MNAFIKLFKIPSKTLALDHFDSALRAHAGQWFSACLRITQDAALAEDAVQDAMLKAWSCRAQFREQAELGSWIYKIAVNCALDLLRNRRGLQGFFADTAIEPPEHDEAALDPFHVGIKLEWHATLASAMHQLTDLERVCFVLKHIESYSLDELSSKLDCSINSIKQALFRATKKLRTTLHHWHGVSP